MTRLYTFSGRELVLTYSPSAAGSIRVEIQGPTGTVIPGYSLEDAPEIIGDEIEVMGGAYVNVEATCSDFGGLPFAPAPMFYTLVN